MSEQAKMNPSLDQEFSKDQEFPDIVKEFNGLDSMIGDGAETSRTDYGLPLNIDNISVTKLDEFEAVGEVTRNIAALKMNTDEKVGISESTEYESGATFQASTALFQSDKHFESKDEAPPLPFFLQPTRTSFKSQKELGALKTELEAAFSKCSISYTPLEEGCGFACSAFRQLTVIKIDVHIFNSDNELLVEVRQVSGCRYAFGEVTDLLAETLQVSLVGCGLAPCPPELTDDDLLCLPELKRETSTEIKCNGEVCSCEYALQLIAVDVPRTTMLQGLRAIGALVESLEMAMNSCSLCGTCGAEHYNHERLFAKEGHWVGLACRVAELAKSDDEDVRTVAMGVVANIASLEHVCRKWIESTIPTLVEASRDEEPHVRREALRSIEAVASKNNKLAAKLVRAGVVPFLELESNGGESGQCADLAMQVYAERALLACRGEAH